MPRVLLVDDEPALLFTLSQLLKPRGVESVLAHSAKEALSKLDGVDGVVTDYSMPGMDGVQLVQAVHERDESLPVVMLTAHGSERIAVRAMKSGAYEYVTKPFDIDELSLVLDRALEARSLRVQNRRLTAEKALGRAIVGDSPAMRRLLEAVNRVGPKDITVLVRGETGTGKELIVPPLHEHREDIPALAAEFARRYAERFGMAGVRLAPELIEALQRADWPGNVRQLENAIARMVALGGGGEIGLLAFSEAAPV